MERNAGKSWVSPQASERLTRKFIYSWTTSVDNQTGNIRVRLVETDIANSTKAKSAECEHTWLFLGSAIIAYLKRHPRNVYDQPYRENELRQTIDEVIRPLEQNGPMVIQKDRYKPETVISVLDNVELKTLEFHTSAEQVSTISNNGIGADVHSIIDTVTVTIDDDISPVYRDQIRLAAWYQALIAAFKNCRYDDFYGSGDNNILEMLRKQPRFLDVPNSGVEADAV